MAVLGDVVWRVLRAGLFDGVRPKIIRSETFRLQGKTRLSNSDFSMIVLGSKISVEYFSKLFYVNKPKIEFLGKLSLSKVASSLDKTKVDLTIVETNWFFSRFLYDNGFFLSPRVDFVLDISGSIETIQNRADKGRRRILRHVAEEGYTFEVTKDQSKLESFYYEMYLPHMLKRHSGSAFPISFSECQELFSRGELLLIKSGDEYVSASLIVPQGDELWEPVLGVKDVDEHLTLSSYAVYFFGTLVGVQRGYARMDFGETPPFMRDGLFQLKKGLGMWVRPAKGSSAQVFGIKFSSPNASVRQFLSENPLLFVDRGGLSGLVFLESVDDSVRSFCVPGLDSLYVVSSSLDVSGLKGFTSVKLGVEDLSSQTFPILRFLGRVCVEGNCSLYRLTW